MILSFFAFLFRDVPCHSDQSVFIPLKPSDLISFSKIPDRFNRVHIHIAIHNDVMMPASFFTAFCDIHISCITQSLLLSLVIQSPDIVLHVLRCHFHRSRHIFIRVCECRPYIPIREVLTDHPFAHLFTVFIVQILLCLSLSFSFPFIRDLVFLPLCKLWIDFHFQLIT